MEYKHVTLERRYEIKAYLQCSKTKKNIVKQLGVHPSTICREIKRNKGKTGNYNPKKAQEYTNIRKERFAVKRKFTQKIRAFVEEKIRQEQWSPEQITVRQYIPKGAYFEKVSKEKIKEIQHKINRRPRTAKHITNTLILKTIKSEYWH